jgi:hypothetical protein
MVTIGKQRYLRMLALDFGTIGVNRYLRDFMKPILSSDGGGIMKNQKYRSGS